jgi:phosphoglycolate phosphatase/pyrophosphatase PpaX
MKIKGIIFDFDGTLADTLPICILSFQQALLNKLGKKYTEAEIVSYFGQTEEGIMQALAEEHWEECFKEYLKVYKLNHAFCPALFDETKDLLDTVKNLGLKMAMVTGKGKHSADISLNYYKIADYFEYIETGSPKGSIKPLCMGRIIEQWGILPHESLYIGDAPTDITDSKIAGVVPVSACWASTSNISELQVLEPYKLFDKMSELKSWIKTLI